MVDDPRYRWRVFLATYITDANITKSDDLTEANWISSYEEDNVPLEMIFYDPKNVDGAYMIGSVTSEADLVDADGTIKGYKETSPITIMTVTKQGIDGEDLWWKMHAELRRICENNPLGSYRSISRVTPAKMDMGGWTLFRGTVSGTYQRDTT